MIKSVTAKQLFTENDCVTQRNNTRMYNIYNSGTSGDIRFYDAN